MRHKYFEIWSVTNNLKTFDASFNICEYRFRPNKGACEVGVPAPPHLTQGWRQKPRLTWADSQ